MPSGLQFPAAVAVLVSACLMMAGQSVDAAAAAPGRDGGERIDARETDRVFARIAQAWQNGDERALAGLVHPDGLRVTGEEAQARSITYSPNQAFYYFKNIFQSNQTVSFEFQRHQDPSAGERIHGLALWRHRRPGADAVKGLKLVFVLIRYQERWMLSEITAIR